MRKICLLIGLFIAVGLSAQTKLTKGGSFKGLNRQGDTLTASTTVNYTIELGDNVYGVINLALESDSVSGTPAYTAYLYKSLNGEDWGTPIDTITHSGGLDDYAEFSGVNATSTYYKMEINATAATQKSQLKAWGRLNEGFVIEQ